MPQESWHEARLIPTSGIGGPDEQERRATSALLAVITAVKEFGRSLTKPFGAPAGGLETYIEVPFVLGDKTYFPDGLIKVTRGSRVWTALVEVKTGTNVLAPDQLGCYLDIAREQGFQAVITISNEIPALPGLHPTDVDKRKLRKVGLHHWSWSHVLAEAVVQKEHRGVADPDQAWILGELIRYLEHPKSGALEFHDMGPAWIAVREAVASGSLAADQGGAAEVAARFDALLCYVGLRLGRKLGTDVTPVLSRRDAADPAARTRMLASTLATNGTLEGAIRIPKAVGDLVVGIDLRAGRIDCQVDVAAPAEGRQTTRVNWLVRQLRAAPADLRIEAFAAHQRGNGGGESIDAVRENPSVLVRDPKKDLRSFRLKRSTPAGRKRGRGQGAFIDSVVAAVDAFYSDVLQNLRAWAATPPRMREPDEPPQPVTNTLVSTALSSQDGTEAESPKNPQSPENGAAVPTGPETTAPADPGSLAT